MATDVKIIVPEDIGSTISLGAKEANKYDVNVSALDLPEQLTSLSLRGTNLVANTTKGDKVVDLAPMLPKVVLDTVLKKVEKRGEDLVFTVGNKEDENANQELKVSVGSILPVVSDGETIEGTGVDSSKLSIKVASGDDNLLEKGSDGLTVSKAKIQALIPSGVQVGSSPIRLVNASGQTVVGYISDTEN